MSERSTSELRPAPTRNKGVGCALLSIISLHIRSLLMNLQSVGWEEGNVLFNDAHNTF